MLLKVWMLSWIKTNEVKFYMAIGKNRIFFFGLLPFGRMQYMFSVHVFVHSLFIVLCLLSLINTRLLPISKVERQFILLSVGSGDFDLREY